MLGISIHLLSVFIGGYVYSPLLSPPNSAVLVFFCFDMATTITCCSGIMLFDYFMYKFFQSFFCFFFFCILRSQARFKMHSRVNTFIFIFTLYSHNIGVYAGLEESF